MGPARTRTAAAVTGVAAQDEGADGQRHRTDGAGPGSDHSSDHLNGLGGLNTAWPVFDTSSIDRFEDGNTAPLASAATSSATSATSGSLPLLQISANCGSCQNSDGDIDQSAETPTCAVVSWCQLGSAGEPCGMKAANNKLQEVHVTELETTCAPGSQEACVTKLETTCAPGSQEAQQTGSEGVSSRTDRKLLQNSQCEHEHQNIEVTVQPTGNSCSKESRKRKLDQSAICLLDVTKSPGIPKQARVEDNYNFNNSSTFDIFPGECEVEHKLSRKLSLKRLIQSGHRKVNDTFEEKTWPQNMHTDDVCVNLREQDDQPPGSVHTDDVCVNLREQDDQPPGSVHTDDVCVNLREQDDQPPGSVHTDDVCVNLREQDDQPPGSVHTDDVCVNLREQDDHQPPGSSQPHAASDRDGVCVGGARSASEASDRDGVCVGGAMSASEASDRDGVCVGGARSASEASDRDGVCVGGARSASEASDRDGVCVGGARSASEASDRDGVCVGGARSASEASDRDGVCVGGAMSASEASDRDGVSVGGARSASEASTQQSSEAQPDLWAKMEVLCEEARSTSCASRCRTFSSLADTVIKRLFTEKNYVFQPGRQPKIQSPWNPGVYPGSRVAKHVLAYDDGYHHGNIRTGSHNTKRANSKARSYSRGIRMKKTFSTSEHMVGRSAGRRHYRLRSNSSSAWSSRSRSRSHSPADSCRSHSCGSDNPDEYACDTWLSEDGDRYSCHCLHQPGSWPRCGRCHGSTPQSPVSASRLASSKSYSRSRSRYKPTKSRNPHWLDIIQHLLSPLVLPSSVTTLIVAPVTGAATTAGKGNSGAAAVNIPSLGNSIDNKHPNTITSSSPEKTKKVNGGQNVFLPNMGDRNKFESKGSNEASLEANANMSLPPRPQNNANSRMIAARMEAGNPEHYAGPPARSSNHFGEHSEHGLQREQPRYEPHYNNMGYHPDLDHSFSEDAGYEFYGGDYDYMYDERNDDYGFGNEPHPGHMHQRHPGPNTYYPRRPPPQGPRGPPQMFTSNERSYGPPRHGMGGPSSRMGPNGPVGSRGPRSPMGPRGHRPQGGPGGPLGPPVMRGPPRGSPYGPPRGSPYGPPGPMRPQGMRGPPGPGMMGQAGHGGPGGPRPRLGPPTRMQSPMPRQGSQPPGGLRPRMGPPPPGPAPREDQYMPPRPGILPSNSGDSNFCSPLPNLSQPPPNFVPSTPSLPPTTSTPVPASHITDVVEPPPPLPPPKPPTPKPPPPPKKEEEKKEEIKPMTPLIPPEQAEQYRKLREQARKHARKQQRKQEHQAKGEPESSDDDDEEKAKRKEYEAKLTAEREEMEKAAMLAVQDNGALHYEEGAAILMPATQPALVQQPTMMVQHHPLASPPSSYGLMPASQLLHAGHPGLHPSQLQNLQFMTSAGQPQLVQLPNGQMAYAMTAPMAYQAAAPTMAMQHQAMSAGAVPHHILLSSGGMHQVPVTAHPGLTVSGSPYMAQYVMATQMQAAQIQAAQMQAAQIQAAQAAQVQAAQAAQVQAAQAAQVQAAQAAQIQAAQAAQVQAAQAAQVQAAQVQSGMPGLVSGVHMGQHVLPGTYPQGQYILVPRMGRPQI